MPDLIVGGTSEEIHFPAPRQGPHSHQNQNECAGTRLVSTSLLHAEDCLIMSQPAARSPFVTAASNSFSLIVLLGLSLATYGYERSLQPLYGSAPTEHHLNKVVWLACIAGMFTPTLSLSNAMLAVGSLLCAMPQTAYWAAVYTGRWHDPVWGPVATHAVVIAPILYWGIAMVKELQVRVSCSPSRSRTHARARFAEKHRVIWLAFPSDEPACVQDGYNDSARPLADA